MCLLLRGQCEVGNSPRVVLGDGGAQKIARDGETSTSNSGDKASLLHSSSGFISPSYGGGMAPSCSTLSRRGSRGAIGGAVAAMTREKSAAQFLRPKTIAGSRFI
jgi:hypothetical protein